MSEQAAAQKAHAALIPAGAPQGILQRKCDCGNHTIAGGECDSCSKDHESSLRRSAINRESANDPQMTVPSIVNEVLRSPGQPLDAQSRAFMEPRFGRDFSDVRVHTDSRAAQSARAVGALAYTLGSNVVFGGGRYSPETHEGKSLLAHELTHVTQNGGKKSTASAPISIGPAGDRSETEADENATAVARGESGRLRSGTTAAGQPGRLSRATMTVGPAKVEINYGNLINIPVADFESAIETRFESWTGSPATTIHADLTVLLNAAKEWVLFGLDLLVDNPVAGLDKVQAVKRLIQYAPSAKFRGLGTARTDFENEAMSVSGWFEKALTARLTKPTGTDLSDVQKRINPNTSSGGSTCPSPRPVAEQLDSAKLKSDLPPKLEAYLKTVTLVSPAVNQPMGPLEKIGDAVQQRARRFYAPYADRSRGGGNTLVQQWQYSSHMISSQSPAGTPHTDLRLAYLDSRARIVGDQGLFATVHFDSRCPADEAVLDGIVRSMEPLTTIQGLIDPILRQKSYTDQNVNPKKVVINPQVSAATPECEARWKTVRTICHELMHVMVHDDFRNADKGRMIMREGFPEVLGHHLYENITGDSSMKSKVEDGLPSAPCASVPGSTIGYGAAGTKAEEIRKIVKDDRFRAAFFLGQLGLAGIQPKLAVGTSTDPLEQEADRIANQAVTSSGHADARITAPPLQRHRYPLSGEMEAPVSVDHVLTSSGKPLETGVRRDMEQRLGHDFSRVRVHSDHASSQSARAINAEAYTMGHNIVFGAGRFDPASQTGRRLLAHELTHVIQQTGQPGLVQRKCKEELGAPTPDCTPSKEGVAGWQFMFKVGCDELLPGEDAKIEKFKLGSRLNIHGFASKDGTETFNDQLSCHRANKIAELARAKRADCPVTGIFKQGESPATGPGVAPDPNPRSFWRSVIVQEVKRPLESGEAWLDPIALIHQARALHARAQRDPTQANLDKVAAQRRNLKFWLEETPVDLAPEGSKLTKQKLDDYRRFYTSAEEVWRNIDVLLALHKHSGAGNDQYSSWVQGRATNVDPKLHATNVSPQAKYHIDIFGEGYYPTAINIGMGKRLGGNVDNTPNLIYRKFSGKDANKIPIADHTADLITAESGPIGLPGLAEEIARIIAPGGTIILFSPESEEAAHDRVAKATGGTVKKTKRDGSIETRIVIPEP